MTSSVRRAKCFKYFKAEYTDTVYLVGRIVRNWEMPAQRVDRFHGKVKNSRIATEGAPPTVSEAHHLRSSIPRTKSDFGETRTPDKPTITPMA